MILAALLVIGAAFGLWTLYVHWQRASLNWPALVRVSEDTHTAPVDHTHWPVLPQAKAPPVEPPDPTVDRIIGR